MDHGQLEQLLRAELTTLQALAGALEGEHLALLATDVAALETATATKNAAIAAHREQQAQRLAWMQTAQLAPDTPLDDLVSAAGGGAAARQLQAELAALAADCQDSNRRNGLLILRLQEQTRGALDVLRRDESGTDLYSLSGAREHRSDSRSLGKA